MKEYRAQLDADRAQRLSRGTNHAHLRVKAEDVKSKARFHRVAGKRKLSGSPVMHTCSLPVAHPCTMRCWQLLKHNSSGEASEADVHVSVIRRGRRRSRKGRTRRRERNRRKTARTRRRRAREKRTLAAIAAAVAKVMTGKPESLMVLSDYQSSCRVSEHAEGCVGV